MNLTKNAKFTRLTVDGANYSLTAGTGDTSNGTVVDMANFEAATFEIGVGTITGAGTVAVTVQEGALVAMGDAADLSGATHTFSANADSNKAVLIEVNQPKERYLRLKVVRGGGENAVIDFAQAIQTGPRVLPVTQGTNIDSAVFTLSPAEV